MPRPAPLKIQPAADIPRLRKNPGMVTSGGVERHAAPRAERGQREARFLFYEDAVQNEMEQKKVPPKTPPGTAKQHDSRT